MHEFGINKHRLTVSLFDAIMRLGTRNQKESMKTGDVQSTLGEMMKPGSSTEAHYIFLLCETVGEQRFCL